jgi:integrator complex subunit 2
MHICLDFLPELLAQPIVPDLSKQLFAVDLISHLSLQYALPKSFSVARLAVNTLSTLLSVLPSQGRTEIYLPALPALVRLATAFPPLVDDIIGFLVQLGRICLSQSCLHGSYDHRIVSSMLEQLDREEEDDDNNEKEQQQQQQESQPLPESFVSIKQEPMEVEAGELEEGELDDVKHQIKPSKSPVPTRTVSPPIAHVKRPPRTSSNLHGDQSIPFSKEQIRKLFNILPQASLMGAEVSRTFARLSNESILHKKIY